QNRQEQIVVLFPVGNLLAFLTRKKLDVILGNRRRALLLPGRCHRECGGAGSGCLGLRLGNPNGSEQERSEEHPQLSYCTLVSHTRSPSFNLFLFRVLII